MDGISLVAYWDTQRNKIWSDLIGFDSLILSLSFSISLFIFFAFNFLNIFHHIHFASRKLYKLNDTVILFTMYCVKLSISIVLMASISVPKNHSIEKLVSIVFFSHRIHIVWLVMWLPFISFWPLALYTRSWHHPYLRIHTKENHSHGETEEEEKKNECHINWELFIKCKRIAQLRKFIWHDFYKYSVDATESYA